MQRHRVFILLMVSVLVLAGCTTLRYPQGISYHSSIEQELQWQSMETACGQLFNNSSFADEGITAQYSAMQKKMEEYAQEEDLNYSKSSYEADRKKYESLKQLYNNSKVQKFSGKRIFLEIHGDPKDTYMCQSVIETLLRKWNIPVTASEKDADYKLRVLIRVNGIDVNNYSALFFYCSNTILAKSQVLVAMTSQSDGSVVYEDILLGQSYYQNRYILSVFGPIIRTSL